MHTRRVGAFLIGAWLLGSLLIAFVKGQSLLTVDRTLSNPPQAMQREFEEMGPDSTRQLLRYEAQELNRHLSEAWGVMQLGIAAALLATAFLTEHRSRVVIAGTGILALLVAYQYFSLTPTLTGLTRSFDFEPATAQVQARENAQRYESTHTMLEIVKACIGLLIAGRLLFDRYDWTNNILPSRSKGTKVRRRRRSSSSSAGAASSASAGASAVKPTPAASAPASDSPSAEQVDAVDHTDHRHIDG